MTALEQAARIAWLHWGDWAKWTVCSSCEEWRPCRSRGGTKFLCLACFDQR